MKRVSIFVLLLAACLSLAAQSREVKGVVIYASDSQPVVGAEVRVKGTEIQTLTDVDGRFTLEVPDDARKLRITSIGMQTRTVTLPREGEEGYGEELLVNVLPEERFITPFVQLAVNASRPRGDEETNATSAKVGYKAGVGVSFALSHYISLTPSINVAQKTGKWKMDDWAYYDTELDPLYLEIPVLVELKLWGKNNNKTIISFGPYVAFGVGGKYTTYTNVDGSTVTQGEKYEGDLFGDNAPLKRFDAGLQIGFGWQVKHIYFGLNAQYGLTNLMNDDFEPDHLFVPTDKMHNFVADFTLAYRF